MSGQNKSHAVMAQRIEPSDSLDDFPTPPWAVRSFCEWLSPDPWLTVLEPACNRGHMVRPLREYFSTVYASDIHDYGHGFDVRDFIEDPPPPNSVDWVITNPPFRRAQEFVKAGRRVAYLGVAVLVRSVWAEGVGRYQSLFRDSPPSWILQNVERVPMVRGRYDPKASTATSYSWFVWEHAGGRQTRFDWLPPAKSRLFRSADTTHGIGD